MSRGTLYLIPTGLGASVAPLLPAATLDVVHRLRNFIVENPRSARAFLKAAGYAGRLQDVQMASLDEHTPEHLVPALLQPLERGIDCGLLSEAGCPGVADPGANLVRCAHASGIRVAPLVGPSALLLALMASGLNGQRFAFHGYLPVDRSARARRLLELERESERLDVAQMFIETPYRNEALLGAILETCEEDTFICVASDLTATTESIDTRQVSQWKRAPPRLARRPTVFLLYREMARGRARNRRPAHA